MPQVTHDTIDESLGNFPLRRDGYIIAVKRPEGFEMTEPEVVTVQRDVGQYSHKFDCEIGRLKMDGREYYRTYLVEIDTGKVANEITAGLSFSCGYHSYSDVVEAGMELAKGVLKDRGLAVVNYISSYPKIIFVCDKVEQPLRGYNAGSDFDDLALPGRE